MTSNKNNLNDISDALTYRFFRNGESFSVPALSTIPIGVLRKARKTHGALDQAFILLESAIPEGSPALDAIDSMPPAEFNEWLEGWTQGATPGESVSSES